MDEIPDIIKAHKEYLMWTAEPKIIHTDSLKFISEYLSTYSQIKAVKRKEAIDIELTNRIMDEEILG